MTSSYVDDQGNRFDLREAEVGMPTDYVIHNRLHESACFLRNVKRQSLPGRYEPGFVTPIADGGASFWCWRACQPGDDLLLIDPDHYRGALSDRFCARGLLGRVVVVRVFAEFGEDVGEFMPGMERDHASPWFQQATLYLSPHDDRTHIEKSAAFPSRGEFVFGIDRLQGSTLRCLYTTDFGLAASAHFCVTCSPIFEGPSGTP